MTGFSHLEILEEGPEAWNTWRVENPGVKPVLAAEDLSELDLTRANLTGANLGRTTLVRAGIVGANLRNADIYGADLTDMEYGTYPTTRGHFYGIRGLPSCYGNELFVRDAKDHDYLDTLENTIEATTSTALRRWKRFWYRAWGLIGVRSIRGNIESSCQVPFRSFPSKNRNLSRPVSLS